MTGSGISAQFGMAVEAYTNEVQQISGTASIPFTLTFDGATTATIAVNASAAVVQAALEALPNIGTGGVVGAGGALPAAVTLTFSGPLVAGRDVPALTVGNGATGLTLATNTPGAGYGTSVTPTRFLEVVDEGVTLAVDRITAKSLRSGSRIQRTDRWAPGKRQAGGTLSFELGSKGFSLLLGQIFGQDPTITTPAGGTLTRDHTFAMTTQDYTNRSFTAQLGIPDVNGTVRPFTYNGCKVAKATFSLDVDGILMLVLELDAQDEATATGLAAASYASTFEVFYWTEAQAALAGANIDVRKFSMTIDTGLNQDRFFFRNSGLKKQPIAKQFIDISGSVELEFQSLTEYQRYVNGSTTSLNLLVEGSTIEAITGGPGKYGIQFTMPNVRFDGTSPDLNGQDIVPQILAFNAMYDGVSAALTTRYRTTDTVA